MDAPTCASWYNLRGSSYLHAQGASFDKLTMRENLTGIKKILILSGRDPVQCRIAGILVGIGIALWFVTVLVNRATGQRPAEPAWHPWAAAGL